jgi:sirohydrochlorin cobaltochelatase
MPPLHGVILVGHGMIPADFPKRELAEFRRLSAAEPSSARIEEIKARLRRWPRTPDNDPYRAGLEAIGEALRRALPDRLVLTAYNEFCSPTPQEAAAEAVRRGASEISLMTTMFTRGGIHSETELPEIARELGRRHPQARFRYVWPYDLGAVAAFLSGELFRTQTGSGLHNSHPGDREL